MHCTHEAELLGWVPPAGGARHGRGGARRAVEQGAPRRVAHAMRASGGLALPDPDPDPDPNPNPYPYPNFNPNPDLNPNPNPNPSPNPNQTALQQHGCNALANLAAMAAPSRAHARRSPRARRPPAGAMRAHMKNVPLLEQACAALFNLARCGTLTRELEARPRDFGEAVQGLVAVLKAHPRREVLQHCGRQVVLQLAERLGATGRAIRRCRRSRWTRRCTRPEATRGAGGGTG